MCRFSHTDTHTVLQARMGVYLLTGFILWLFKYIFGFGQRSCLKKMVGGFFFYKFDVMHLMVKHPQPGNSTLSFTIMLIVLVKEFFQAIAWREAQNSPSQ